MRAVPHIDRASSAPDEDDRVDPLARYRLAILLGLIVAGWVIALLSAWGIWELVT